MEEEKKCLLCGKKKSTTDQQKKQKSLFCSNPTKHQAIHNGRVHRLSKKIERVRFPHYEKIWRFKWAKQFKNEREQHILNN